MRRSRRTFLTRRSRSLDGGKEALLEVHEEEGGALRPEQGGRGVGFLDGSRARLGQGRVAAQDGLACLQDVQVAGEEVIAARHHHEPPGLRQGIHQGADRSPLPNSSCLAMHEQARRAQRRQRKAVSLNNRKGNPRARSARTRGSRRPPGGPWPRRTRSPPARGAGPESDVSISSRAALGVGLLAAFRGRVPPSLRPTPRKLKRSTASPCSCRALAARNTTLKCIIPPCRGWAWQTTAAADRLPFGMHQQGLEPSRRPLRGRTTRSRPTAQDSIR